MRGGVEPIAVSGCTQNGWLRIELGRMELWQSIVLTGSANACRVTKKRPEIRPVGADIGKWSCRFLL